MSDSCNKAFHAVKKKNQTSGSPCGLPRRLAIILYDAVVVLALLMLAALLAILAGIENQVALKDPWYTLYLALFWFAYFCWCWHRGGMTVGMRAWRVKIEDANGNRPGWGRSMIRLLVAVVSAAVAGAGFLWSLADTDRRTWHDIASATRLVRI
ncbi:MAG: RDD family protein [Xanthomonadales bacterium]|nr:RDD family protein [Gammaproteobacteria bacterium]MBT8052640.1 RDD family protein [Gammaproteobacteria bacterium]NND56601.1 RDD family protein [Xanthomonadales bacterium]NNK52457.1 RDD family protein [Xanthomonadales bacterium]